jgi:hypothetical protein
MPKSTLVRAVEFSEKMGIDFFHLEDARQQQLFAYLEEAAETEAEAEPAPAPAPAPEAAETVAEQEQEPVVEPVAEQEEPEQEPEPEQGQQEGADEQGGDEDEDAQTRWCRYKAEAWIILKREHAEGGPKPTQTAACELARELNRDDGHEPFRSEQVGEK